MEKNIKEFNALKNKIEKCFEELKYNYKYMDLDDGDINYRISIDVSGIVKNLNVIWFIIFANIKEVSITLTAINIYRFGDDEDLTPYYKIMNDVNGLLTHGKFSINDVIKEIVYSSSINCAENFNDLTKDKISFLTRCYLDNLKKLLPIFFKRVNNGTKKN